MTATAPVTPVRRPTRSRVRDLLERVTICSWRPFRGRFDGPREYLCPAPTSRMFRCLRPLPCTSHAIGHPNTGLVIYGSIFLR